MGRFLGVDLPLPQIHSFLCGIVAALQKHSVIEKSSGKLGDENDN